MSLSNSCFRNSQSRNLNHLSVKNNDGDHVILKKAIIQWLLINISM
jgi:hypothetical protein